MRHNVEEMRYVGYANTVHSERNRRLNDGHDVSSENIQTPFQAISIESEQAPLTLVD